MKNKIKKLIENKKGFTIVESLFAIFILVISVTGPMAFTQSGLRASFIARDQVTAFYLAQDAIEYITQYRNLKKSITFVKYEILLKFNNNDRIEASFQNKETAISFLKQFDTMNFQLVNKK